MPEKLRQIIHRVLGLARQLLSGLAGGSAYRKRLENEKKFYEECLNVHDLPDIFHYWSNEYLVPMFKPFGFTSPDDFFLVLIREKCEQSTGKDIRIISIGSGNCDVEIEIGRKLFAMGLDNFHFECIEINPKMTERAKENLGDSDLASNFSFLEEDFNRWRPVEQSYDVVMANQSLHHVLELEHLFDSIRLGLARDGIFLTSDVIGRNGHQRWPEALALVDTFWQELPDPYRYNQLMKRWEKKFINHDCSTSGFEGIRAQDILPLLEKRFNFRIFIPYGNLIFPFIDRPFGHNFDAKGDWDRDFIDRVHAADEGHLLDGSIKPTSMLAAMTLAPEEPGLRNEMLAPRFCIRETWVRGGRMAWSLWSKLFKRGG